MKVTGASISTYELIQGHQVFKTVLTPLLGEILPVSQEDDNDHNEYDVAKTA